MVDATNRGARGVIWTLWPPLVAGYARGAGFAAADGFASPSPRAPSSRATLRERVASTI